MRKKIFFAILSSTVIVLFTASFFIIETLYQNFETAIYEDLKTYAKIIEQKMLADTDSIHTIGVLQFANLRLTLIGSDGTVFYESNFEHEKMTNHLSRPEVQSAFKTGEGKSYRLSQTLTEKFYYYACKLPDGTILRVATKHKTVLQLLLQNGMTILTAAICLCIGTFFISFFLAKDIVRPINDIDIENLEVNNYRYNEIKPLLKKISEQKKQLERDKANLKQAELIRKDFTANVSHELKTPLQAISGYAELLKNGIAREADIKPFAEKIFSESFRMHNLVDDIISLTELESVEKKGPLQETDFVAVCTNVIDSLTSIAEKKEVGIYFDYAKTDAYSILSVPELVHTIMYNLIDNAIKYNKVKGSIFVSLEHQTVNTGERQKNYVCFKVRDTGCGIESENLPRIFERFYRVDKSRSKIVGGTGLGLSIVKHSVASLRASIDVKSQVGEGTEFTVLFHIQHDNSY